MGTIIERAVQRQIHVLDRIDRLASLVVIIFRDENNIGIRQFFIILLFVQIFHVHHTGMISCPVRVCAIVRALNLNVILLARTVGCIGIQTD